MGFPRRWALVLGLLWVLLPRLAEAGRRPFIWAYDTEIVPEGDVELEQWLWVRGRSPAAPSTPAHYWVWWSPVIGLSSYLELQFPFQLATVSDKTTSDPFKTTLDSFEVDLRYRLLGRESTDPFQPLVRLTYHQGISGTPSRVDANLVGSYDFTKALHGVVDLGGRLALPALNGKDAPPTLLGTYDVGLAYHLGDSDFHISAEVFGELPLLNLTQEMHHLAGASVMWTHGRVWITAGVLAGLTPIFRESPSFMPRLICGVLL